MIKQVTVIVCDVCGSTKDAERCITTTGYQLPTGWARSNYNSNTHICEKCRGCLGDRLVARESERSKK